MSRPKKIEIPFTEKVQRIKAAGLPAYPVPLMAANEEMLAPLSDRIKLILGLIKTHAVKPTHMTVMILYDIENNKVRTEVAKYLIKQGCVRIQKSVYLASLKAEKFKKLQEDLKEVQACYDNTDSILLVPLNTEDARSMKIIGKNIALEAIIDKPNTLFF